MSQPLKKEAAFEIFQVDPDELNKYWNFVQAELKKMVTENVVDWRPEHIYVGILSGGTKLFIAEELETEHHQFIGFFVAIQQQILWTNKTELFIWALGHAYSVSTIGIKMPKSVEPYVTQVMNFLTAYAKGLGCSRIHMLSPRKGFEIWGFKPRQIDYYRDI